MLAKYFRNCYRDTMDRAYGHAEAAITARLKEGGYCLDCGATDGYWYDRLDSRLGISMDRYTGIEWNAHSCAKGRARGLNMIQGDLNDLLPFPNNRFRCIIALSVLEHLLYGCRFLQECYRVLEPGGSLVLLTPNISTYFTAFRILQGKMPSSGPHPDSTLLLCSDEPFRVRDLDLVPDVESDRPVHRHLVVFSYRVLNRYLAMLGFARVEGRGFGLYPFPVFMQPFLEQFDPFHCHQMVFVATKVISEKRSPH
ncbi:MAG: class I SAM-dependent methyltransferase [Nitrosomonas ureae]